jgi:hypothetical protein
MYCELELFCTSFAYEVPDLVSHFEALESVSSNVFCSTSPQKKSRSHWLSCPKISTCSFEVRYMQADPAHWTETENKRSLSGFGESIF